MGCKSRKQQRSRGEAQFCYMLGSLFVVDHDIHGLDSLLGCVLQCDRGLGAVLLRREIVSDAILCYEHHCVFILFKVHNLRTSRALRNI